MLLNKNEINWSNHSFNVRRKGDKEREVYFNIRAEIWLYRYLNQRNDEVPALLVTDRAPCRFSIAETRHIIKKVSSVLN